MLQESLPPARHRIIPEEKDNVHLTKRQQEIYQFLKDHIHHKGYAPSIMEIGDQFNLSSPATVHKHLTHLEDKDLIRREHNLSRAIEIVEQSVLSREYVLLGHIVRSEEHTSELQSH